MAKFCKHRLLGKHTRREAPSRERGLMNLAMWSKRFIKAGKKDDYNILRDYVEIVHGIKYADIDIGRAIFEETIKMAEWVCAYDILGPDYKCTEFDHFLRMQSYDPREASDAVYIVGVMCSSSEYPARILADCVDFTDLAQIHFAFGLSSIDVTRCDGRGISASEYADIKDVIKHDIRSDFGEDDIKIRYKRSRKSILAHFSEPMAEQ